MGYFICQHCGAHLHDSKVEDLYQWDDEDSMGWSYICPRCKEENYKEINFDDVINKIQDDFDLI